MATPTILFVPGAWHESSVFDDVRNTLSSRGFETSFSPLPTYGAESADIGLVEDVAAVRSDLLKLVDAGKDVVIVAHSYGGVVASSSVQSLGKAQRAADGKDGGVILLLYLAAFALPANTSLLGAFGNVHPHWWDVTEDLRFMMPFNPGNTFYADVEPPLAEKAIAMLRRIPYRIVTDKSTYAPFNEGFGVGYIFAEKDEAVPVSVQREMFARFPRGSFSASLDSSHSPFLSMSVALADVILDGIAHVRAIE